MNRYKTYFFIAMFVIAVFTGMLIDKLLHSMPATDIGKYSLLEMWSYAFDDALKTFSFGSAPLSLPAGATNQFVQTFIVNESNLQYAVTFYGAVTKVSVLNRGDGDSSFWATFTRDPLGTRTNYSTCYMSYNTSWETEFDVATSSPTIMYFTLSAGNTIYGDALVWKAD